MVQNIIDEDICHYTVEIMAKVGIGGNFIHTTKHHHRYNLLQNPFSKQPIKLLPKDILSNLPVADRIDSVVYLLFRSNLLN